MDNGLGIKAARVAARMSQAHLAKAAGVSRRTIVRAEAGEVLSSETARCLMAVLDGCPAPKPGAPAGNGPPRMVAMSWIDDCADGSLRHAAMFAYKHLGHYEALYVGVIPYEGGHIWEAQEGGGGTGHLEDAVRALDGQGGWFVTSHRVFTVSRLGGRPAFLMHPQSKPPNVTGMLDMRAGGSRLRTIRAPFDPFRPEAHRETGVRCACGGPKVRARSDGLSP